MLKRFLLSIAAVALLGAMNAKEYSATHVVAGGHGFDLIFPCEPADEIYAEGYLSLDVLELWCDGRKIEPHLLTGHFRYNFQKLKGAKTHIYTLSSASFILSKKAAHEVSSSNAWKYEIPTTTKIVRVKYRFLLPDWTYTEPNEIESRDILVD